MVRGISVVLGIGLVILWIAGLNTAGAPAWLVWLDLAAAIAAFVIAGTVPTTQAVGRTLNSISAGPIALGVALLAMWIIALATGSGPAVPWWNFAFGCAFLITAFLPPSERRTLGSVESPFRRSA